MTDEADESEADESEADESEADESEPDETEAGDGEADETSRRRRLPRYVVAAALLVGVVPLMHQMPREREVHIALSEPERIDRLEIMWFAEGNEPVRVTHYDFHGVATPAVIVSTLSLKAGDYRLVLRLERRGRRHEVTQIVRFDLLETRVDLSVQPAGTGD